MQKILQTKIERGLSWMGANPKHDMFEDVEQKTFNYMHQLSDWIRKTESLPHFMSQALGLEFWVDQENMMVYFEDGVEYSWEEVHKIKGSTPEEKKKIHAIKKKFVGSEIIKGREEEIINKKLFDN